jgi:C4-dicarboxylate-specific signal transduction histidine kinase
MGQTKRQLNGAGRTARLGQAMIASVAIDLQQPLIAGELLLDFPMTATFSIPAY